MKVDKLGENDHNKVVCSAFRFIAVKLFMTLKGKLPARADAASGQINTTDLQKKTTTSSAA